MGSPHSVCRAQCAEPLAKRCFQNDSEQTIPGMMTKPLRLAFMGSPDIAAHVLDALITAGHEIVCVYSQPPRPAGRGKKLTPTPVHAFAEARGIEVRTPKSLKKLPEQEAFAALDLDAAVVVAYGLILPQAVLDAPRLGCLNMHASILPRWRGAAPIQRAIMAGDTETGVDAMIMEAGLDTGPVLVGADSLLLGQHADTSLVSVRRDVSRIPKINEACDRLRAVGVDVMGAVISGVGVEFRPAQFGANVDIDDQEQSEGDIFEV